MGLFNFSEETERRLKNAKLVFGVVGVAASAVAAGIGVASAIKKFKNDKSTVVNLVYPKELFGIGETEADKEPPEMVNVGTAEGKYTNGVFIAEKLSMNVDDENDESSVDVKLG